MIPASVFFLHEELHCDNPVSFMKSFEWKRSRVLGIVALRGLEN